MILENEFYTLHVEATNLTNKFTELSKEGLQQNPQIILILRLRLSYGKEKFSKMLGISKWRIHDIENKRKSYLTEQEKELITHKLSQLLKERRCDKTEKELYEQYLLFKKYGHMDTRRAKEIRRNVSSEKNILKGVKTESNSKPKNNFERIIINLLQDHSIPFSFHSVIKAKNKFVVVDFAIPSGEEPIIILEVKQSISTQKRRRYERMKQYTILMDHRIHHIKLEHPHIIGIIVLSDKYNFLEDIPISTRYELLTADKLFFDGNLHELPQYIAEQLNGKL